MEIVLKTLLYSYPSFEIVIEGYEKLAEYKALTSFANSNKTLKQMDEIIKLNSQMARMDQLKGIVEDLMNSLSIKERMLIEYKYFKYEPFEGFDYTSRNYFRAQIKVFNKLLKKLEIKGYDVNWFESNYCDLYVLANKYRKLKKLKQQGIASNSARDVWF